MSEHELLSKMLGLPYVWQLSVRERAIFARLFIRSVLNRDQQALVHRVAKRLGLEGEKENGCT